MAWDEGNAIVRADGIAHWAARWWRPRTSATGGEGSTRARANAGDTPAPQGPLSRAAIEQDWRYTTQVEGHPALYGIVIAAGRPLADGWLSPLGAARFGPIVLWAIAAGALFYRMGREWSLAAAMGATAALMLLPRVFAHAHFASFDGPLTSCWLLTWAAFASARQGRAAAVGWGILLGMTLSCKLTGWLAPLPFVAWASVYRDRAAARALAIGVPVALAAFVVFNPPLWHQPVAGLVKFFSLNLHRPPELNISTQFLGRMCNLDYPLPWYNTLVWTAVAVPVGLLALAVAGLVHIVRHGRSESAGVLVLLEWAVLLVVRALPGVPPHDGIRLFLPSFAMLAALAGLGCHAFMAGDRAAPRPHLHPSSLILRPLLVLVLLYAGSATSLAWYAPQWLSYYNLLLGGLPGATALGMEPTYYWDALDQSVWEWLERHTPPRDKIGFGSAPPENLALLRSWGVLRRDYREDSPGRFAWYVIQRRPSAWEPCDQWLMEHSQPSYQKRIRSGGWGPWRLDVPLIDVYPYSDYLRACREVRREVRGPCPPEGSVVCFDVQFPGCWTKAFFPSTLTIFWQRGSFTAATLTGIFQRSVLGWQEVGEQPFLRMAGRQILLGAAEVWIGGRQDGSIPVYLSDASGAARWSPCSTWA